MIEYETKRQKNPMRSLFAAFMAGALAIGGLSYASDKLNWFGGSPAAISSDGSGGTAVTTSLGTSAGTGSVAAIAEKASPAVVKIETQTTAQGGKLSRRFAGNGANGGIQSSAIGSGFIFDSSGFILTNEHVVRGADSIQVTVQGHQQPFTAKVIGSSRDLDLAVIKIQGTAPFPSIKLGNSDTAQIGDQVVAIGNPYDFDFSVTAGILSSKNREISISDGQGTVDYKHLFQTDTAINPGNSGGPLLNQQGEVIGMNTAVSSQAQGIGFAITSGTISTVLDYLIHNTDIPSSVMANISKGA